MKDCSSFLRIRICEGNRRFITARDMISTKHSSTGQRKNNDISSDEPQEQRGNPNGSRKEGGKDLLRPRKQRKGAVELWCEQVDAAADGEAEARFEDDGGARVRGRREEEEEMNG